jgi:hypothetical protein
MTRVDRRRSPGYDGSVFGKVARVGDRLDPQARRRLDRFAGAFDRIDAHDYIQFAIVPGSTLSMAQAEADVLRLLGTGPRRDATRSVISTFIDAAGMAYASHLALPQYLLLNDAVADRPDDRQRFLKALERAIAALVLWDDLTEDDRDVLAGPWGNLVEQAAAAT